MRFVAIDAVISHPWAARQVPVARHTAVRSVTIVSPLRSVALRAKTNGVLQGDGIARGQVKLVVVPGLMARDAAKLAMLEAQPGVDALQSARIVGQGARVAQAVAGGACHAHGAADRTTSPGLDGRELVRLMDDDGASVDSPGRGSKAPFLAAAATEGGRSENDERPCRWRSIARAYTLAGRGERFGKMPVSGILITLDTDPDARAGALRALGDDARVTLGEAHGTRLPAVTETRSASEAEDLVMLIQQTSGVVFVDVVCIDTSLDTDGDDLVRKGPHEEA
jgi:hypothetical protein